MSQEIPIFRGNSKSLRVRVTDKAGDAFDITTFSVRFTVYKNVEEDAVLSLTSDADPTQVIKEPGAFGIADIKLKPSDTEPLSYSHSYKVEIYRGDDDIRHTVAFGKLIVTDDGV